jgi:8-oxo-dGTP pyrophosphatase MutT (NUDIX family)
MYELVPFAPADEAPAWREAAEYYRAGGLDIRDAIDAFGLNFNRGAILKYVARAGRKPGNPALLDLYKAREHLSREIARLRGDDWPVATHCVGFFFDPSRSRVWLVRKNRPQWQAGLLNGIGGKIEPGETPHAAMVREFAEEAGLRFERWEEVVRLEHRARGGVIVFFRAFAASDDEFLRPRAGTDEAIGFYPVLDVIGLRPDVLAGLRVEIPLALDTSGLCLPIRLQDVSQPDRAGCGDPAAAAHGSAAHG